MAGRDDLIDKRGPMVRPFLLQNVYQNNVELIKKSPFALEFFLCPRVVDDAVHDKIANAWETKYRGTGQKLWGITRKQRAGIHLDIDREARPSILS